MTAVLKANTRFACDLYERLRVRDGNLFFSPFSISTALAMTSAGARGETLAEMGDNGQWCGTTDNWPMANGDTLRIHRLSFMLCRNSPPELRCSLRSPRHVRDLRQPASNPRTCHAGTGQWVSIEVIAARTVLAILGRTEIQRQS
jgi:hypothetical protein